MAYVCYDSFLSEVIPFCPGAPEVVAINAVRNAAIEFCESTEWLQFTPNALPGVANLATYEIATPTDTRVGRIITAWWDTFTLVPQSEDQLASNWGVDWRTVTGQPRQYTRTDDINQIVVVPYPTIAETAALKMLISIVPTRGSASCDGDLVEYWLETIAAGAISRLMATPQQPYSNTTVSMIYAKQFRSGVSRAKLERNRGKDRAVLVFRPPMFV